MRDSVVRVTQPDQALLDLVRGVMAVSMKAAADGSPPLSVVQLRALTVLSERVEATLGDLARAMGAAVSSSSRLVDRLVVAGLVDRQISMRNRREIALRLTESGHAALTRYDDRRVRELQYILGRLQPTAEVAVRRALGRFAEAMRTPAPADQEVPIACKHSS
ncbi:MarR family transcriptional regulator [soil metagenome]